MELSAPCSRQTTTPTPITVASSNDSARGLYTLKPGPVMTYFYMLVSLALCLKWNNGPYSTGDGRRLIAVYNAVE